MTDQSTPATPADAATDAAVEAHITGHTEKAAELFERSTIEHERAARTPETGREWDNGQPLPTLPPMPPAPTIQQQETNAAIEKLNAQGGEHAELVLKWGNDFGPNLAYAKEAFRDISANRPDIIQKVEASRLGDDPAIIEFLAQHGRLAAGMRGDNTIAQRQPSFSGAPQRMTTPSSKSAAQAELDAILEKSPPGSPAYKTKAVQQRVRYLNESIYGTAPAIGKGTRTV